MKVVGGEIKWMPLMDAVNKVSSVSALNYLGRAAQQRMCDSPHSWATTGCKRGRHLRP